MQEETYQLISLDRIQPNPMNSRTNFSGIKFEGLKKSIDAHGVLQPIRVRPIPPEGMHEIIFGERRFRALKAVAENSDCRIPAIVQEMDDDTAFDLMTIENLQREDLTELEEARGFKIYLDKKGAGSLQDLADRTGIDARYIRRRVAVLDLAPKILKAWDKDDLKYGHLEQLMRLKDKKTRNEFFKWVLEEVSWREDGIASVKDLKRKIDNLSPQLAGARFDRKKCETCSQNSEVQKTLWGMDTEKHRCLNRICYKRKQYDHLVKHWKKSTYYKKFKTTGFRFQGDVHNQDYNSFNTWSYDPIKPTDKCKKGENGGCAHYLTILELDGTVYKERACFGQDACYRSSRVQEKAEKNDKKMPGDGPRVPWHGTHFREKFYETEIPVRIQASNDELKLAQVALFSLLKSNDDLDLWFAVYSGYRKKSVVQDDNNSYCFSIKNHVLFDLITKMDMVQINDAFREAAIQVVLQDRYDVKSRLKIAAHFGIELEKEWRITEEYLQKKTIGEMLGLGEKLEIFADPKAQTFLFEKLLKKRGAFKSCKKAELIRVFIESGADLAGKVPDEILTSETVN